MVSTITTSAIITELVPNPGEKEIIIETAATFMSSLDQVSVTLADYGIATEGVISIKGFEMSSTYGIIITEVPRTEEYSGVFIISGVAAVLTPAKKIFRLVGKSL